MVRYANCGDGTNSILTEGAKSRWFRSMLVSESNSFPASDAFWVDGVTAIYMFLVKMMSMRDKCEVKSGVQIVVVVVVGEHD